MLDPITIPHNNMQTAPQPRLVRAAHEFEAQMMKELLKPLTASDSLTGTDGDSGSNGALGDYAREALGRAISNAGGFGIANRILGQVSHSDISRSGNHPNVAPVPKEQHFDTAMRIAK